MSKNANGEGSVWKRTRDGKVVRYEGAITYTGDDGKTKRHTVYGRTRADVRDKLKQARERLDSGAPVRDATRTVGDWLAHWRATSLAVSDRSLSTRTLYASLCRKHLEPAPFGAITLDRPRPSDVEALVLAMRAKELSDSTVRQIYTVLRAGLDGAVRDGLIARNPAALVKRPGIQRREAKFGRCRVDRGPAGRTSVPLPPRARAHRGHWAT
jgi:integrase